MRLFLRLRRGFTSREFPLRDRMSARQARTPASFGSSIVRHCSLFFISAGHLVHLIWRFHGHGIFVGIDCSSWFTKRTIASYLKQCTTEIICSCRGQFRSNIVLILTLILILILSSFFASEIEFT